MTTTPEVTKRLNHSEFNPSQLRYLVGNLGGLVHLRSLEKSQLSKHQLAQEREGVDRKGKGPYSF